MILKYLGRSAGGKELLFVPNDEESELDMNEAQPLALFNMEPLTPVQTAKVEKNNLYFALLKKVYDAQAGPHAAFRSSENLRQATLLDVGWSNIVETFDGQRHLSVKSISPFKISRRDQDMIIDRSIDAWCEYFGLDEMELKTFVKEGEQDG